MPAERDGNRRRHTRAPLKTPIGINTPNRKNRVGVTWNVSAGGVLFISASRFDLGEWIEVVIRTPRQAERWLNGCVVRCWTEAGKHSLFTFIAAIKFDAPEQDLLQPQQGAA